VYLGEYVGTTYVKLIGLFPGESSRNVRRKCWIACLRDMKGVYKISVANCEGLLLT